MSKGYGAHLRTVFWRKPYNLVPLSVLLVLFCISILYYAEFDSNLEYLILFGATAFSIFFLFRSIRTPQKKEVFGIYEDGLKSSAFKWTGHCFLPFSEIKDIQYQDITYKGDQKVFYVVVLPRDVSKYVRKQGFFRRYRNSIKSLRFSSPLFVSLTCYYLVSPDEAEIKRISATCQNALETYRARIT